MSLPSRVMASGTSAMATTNIVGDLQDNLVAAGNNQATATQIQAVNAIFTNVPAGAGGVLMPSEPAGYVDVFNLGANPLLLYPNGAQAINALAGGAAFTVPVGKGVTLTGRAAGGWIAQLSA